MTIPRSTLIGIPLVFLSGIAFAQSTDQSSRGLEGCFQVARLADSICEKQIDREQRLGCLEKTRAAQIECLQRILQEEADIAPKASEPSAVFTRDAPQPASVTPPTALTTDGPEGNSSQADTKPTTSEVAVTHDPPAAVVRPPETSQPMEVVTPIEPTQSPEVAKPVERTQPAEALKPPEAAPPDEGAKPVETARAAEAAKPVEMARPMEAGLPSATTQCEGHDQLRRDQVDCQ
jgi:hypothetical protein